MEQSIVLVDGEEKPVVSTLNVLDQFSISDEIYMRVERDKR